MKKILFICAAAGALAACQQVQELRDAANTVNDARNTVDEARNLIADPQAELNNRTDAVRNQLRGELDQHSNQLKQDRDLLLNTVDSARR